MTMKIVLLTCVLLLMVLCQAGQLEQECNILQTLEALQSRLDITETRLQEQDMELAETKSSLSDAVTRLQEQDTEFAETKSLLTDAVTRLEEQETKIYLQNSKIDNFEALARRDTGSTYVRWGRTSCPGNGSELVYSGYVGGSHYTHSGAAVDYLCLPTDPDYAYYEEGVQSGGYVYGAEYEMPFRNPNIAFFPDNDQTINLDEKDVPCAVCRTVRSAVLMVPARTTCHDGWTLEYKGYLSSGYTGHAAASQYVCLDGRPEYLTGGAADDNGKLFYFVEGYCGSLRCPPYVGGRELTCAVCSI